MIGTITFPVQDNDEVDAQGPVFHTLVQFTGDTSYPTGGTVAGLQTALTTQFKDGRLIQGIIPQDCGGYVVTYIPSTDKLKVYSSGGTEVTNATNLGAVTFNLLVLSY
jgi:hypothetical protein